VARVDQCGVGERADRWGPCVSEGEREKTPSMDGVNQRRKHILWNTPKEHVGQAGQQRER
jgi:hypothetical protein